MEVTITDAKMREAAGQGMDAFIKVVVDAISEAVGGELNAESMQKLNADQITLWGYQIFHDEVMDGGYVQLIHNGYGAFIFLNPFAKAMRLWGLKDFSKMLYEGRALYEQHAAEIEKDCTDEEFMALYEQYPDFEDLDDRFVVDDEEITEGVARYLDEHLNDFVTIVE